MGSVRLHDFGDGSNVFFTSDTHFCHGKIVELSHRPFSSPEEMNEVLIDNWNKVVGKNDTIFHLGDFCFGGTTKWTSVLNRLNGNKWLIMGNHDFKNLNESVVPYFMEVTQQMRIYIDGWTIYLNHFPFLCFGGSYNLDRKIGQLFGHVHSNDMQDRPDMKRMEYLFPTQYDVGVDNNGYSPISWKQVKKIFERNIEKYYLNNV